MNDHGIKISKEGFDVNVAEPRDLILSSEYPCLKIIKSGKITYTDSGSYTVPHGTSMPVFAKIYDYRNSKYQEVSYNVDTSNIYFTVDAPSEASSNVYYFICLT
jgi:hypothetical protein